MLMRMLEATARRHAAHPALVWRNERVSYARLLRAVRARSRALGELGVGPSRAVALLLPNGPEFVVELLAVAARGALAVPLNPQFKPEEVGAYLAACGVVAIAATPETAGVARRAIETAVPSAVLEERAAGAALAEVPAGHEDAAPLVSSGDVLCGFSSGSTGTPKRILRSQANLVAEAEQFTATVGLEASDAILGVVPFFHAHGLGNCVLAAIRSGATLVIEERFEPRRVLRRLETERVSVLPGVPFIFRLLAEVDGARRVDLSALRLCFSAGAPLPRSVFEAFDKRFGMPVRQLYGCTEAGSVTINLDPDAVGSADSVGRPMRGVEVSIVDDRGEPREVGAIGEVAFSSPALGRLAPEASEEERAAFREGRFFSGDLGMLDASGRLTLTGRKKIFVSTAAGKVDPVEVERCLGSHPGVREVVVVGVEARGRDELVKAVVVAEGAGTPDAQAALRRELIALCRQRLAEFKVPRRIEFRGEIPKSPLGKVLRKYLV